MVKVNLIAKFLHVDMLIHLSWCNSIYTILILIFHYIFLNKQKLDFAVALY
jgi:hypothetical protein